QSDWLAARFEEHRGHLRAVAYRMLGSVTEADDAVQDAWVRVSRAGASEVENLGGWLTTIVARVCLNMLRARQVMQAGSTVHVPDPIVSAESTPGPEDEALLADSVGLALLVVLDTLAPAERLVFVLHDMFALPFEDIAPLVGRTPTAARQLASRARRRLQGADVQPDTDVPRQRVAVDAFFAAARNGDFDALVGLLHPEATLRIDTGASRPGVSMELHGADAVAKQTLKGFTSILNRPAIEVRPILVNGAAGAILLQNGEPLSVIGFVVVDGKVVEMDAVADAERVRHLVPAAEH